MVMIYEINSELKDEDVKSDLCIRNMRDCDVTEFDFNKGFEIKTRYKDKSGGKTTRKREHVVIKCSVRIRNWLRS